MAEFNLQQKQLYEVVETICVQSKTRDYNGIKDIAGRYNRVLECTEEEVEQVIARYLATHEVYIGEGLSLVEEDYKPWYFDSKKNFASKFWDRYYKYLYKSKGFSINVLNSIDKSTDEIMDLLGDPNSLSSFSRKGMIIGDVQSGKTATYIGLMNKAADAGYRVIILLTGLIEKLRSQTQERVDYGFIGLDSNKLDSHDARIWVGAGEYDTSFAGWGLTSKSQDFNLAVAQMRGKLENINTTVVFVLKKNKTILTWLEKWLNTNVDSSGKVPLPMLLIDDEADNGSINTKADPSEATAINASIRRLVALFTQVTYIGCTATPYANIFIDPDCEDLFPSNFIYSLPTPSNYVGATSIFSSPVKMFTGEDDADESYITGKYHFMLKNNDDCEKYIPLSHKSEFSVKDLPETMKKAVLAFFIANAIRDLRGDKTSHRTMLVNVSRFIKVQNDLTSSIDAFVREYRREIDNYCALDPKEALLHEKIKDIYTVFKTYYDPIPDDKTDLEKEYSWKDIQHALKNAVSSIQVRSVNGGNAVKNLDYEENKHSGLRLIAVGGLSLSRGLTLEGLMISYYYRNTKMYDTMMQMGRWFGYRDGYADLCQIWMSTSSQDWYAYITKATEELKRDFRIMHGRDKTPAEFGLRVRSDKAALLVTAKNKMRLATTTNVLISLSQAVEETKYISLKSDVIESNYQLVENWIKLNLRDDNRFKDENRALRSSFQFKNIPCKEIASLIGKFDASVLNSTFAPDTLSEMINKSAGCYPVWDVLIACGKKGHNITIGDYSISRVQRSYAIKKGPIAQVAGDSAHLASRNAYKCGLTISEYKDIETKAKSLRPIEKRNQELNQEEFFVQTRKQRNPVLVIWPLELTGCGKVSDSYLDDENTRKRIDLLNASGKDIAVIGFSIGCPKVDDSAEVKACYKINKIYAKNMFGVTDEEDGFEDIGDELSNV